MLFIVFSVVTVAYVLKSLVFSKHEKIYGIYSQPGPFYWLKWLIFNIFYRFQRSRGVKLKSEYDHGSDLRYLEDENKQNTQKKWSADFGMDERSKTTHQYMERVQNIPDSPHGVDAVYFNGFEDSEQSVNDAVSLVMAYTKRYKNSAEILFFLNIPEIGFLQHPTHPDRIVCDAWQDDYGYYGQGMAIEMLEPMRRWRISYNGLMRLVKRSKQDKRKIDEKSDEMIHVKFSFIWRSYSPVFEFNSGVHPACIADAFAREPWNKEFFESIKTHYGDQSHYEQWGQLRGTVVLDNEMPREILLRGMREHSFNRRDWTHFHRYIIFLIHLENGTSINISAIGMDVTLSQFGYVIQPNRKMEAISSSELNLWQYGEDGAIPEEMKFSLVAGGKNYCIVAKIRVIPKYYSGYDWESCVHENLADFIVNGIPGKGIVEFVYRQHDMQEMRRVQSKKKILPVEKFVDEFMVVGFDETACCCDVLVGGKGSQLGILKKWSKETEKFKVPNGFCITTNAYKQHIQANPKLGKMIDQLNLAVCCEENMQNHCQSISTAFEQSSLKESINKAMKEEYDNLGANLGSFQVSVRSSAVGEDSADLSAAGQLDTILGVNNFEKVIAAVKKCWSSLYSHQAVQYRNQHGQPVVSEMGVVVQLMEVSQKTSGVLFTQHPVTGHPAHVMINANYGLGETVVSGSAEPDTITVSCFPDKPQQVITKYVGNKAHAMFLENAGGVKQVETSSQESSVICLTDEEIFSLVDVGLMIQDYFGTPRDIEWAMSSSGEISLLQARPITTDFTETDFELTHEFDSGFSNEKYALTTANIGEMMPGAMSPLTTSTFFRSVDYCTQEFFYESNAQSEFFQYNDVHTAISHRNGFLVYNEMLALNTGVNLTSKKESLDINLFGEVIDLITEEEAYKYHDNFTALPFRIWNTVKFWKTLLASAKQFKLIYEKAEMMSLTADSSKDLYRVISENMSPYYAESWRLYLGNAALSGLSSTILMVVLTKGQTEWKTEHYSDVAMIYGSCGDIVSADAPTYLGKIAKQLHNSSEKSSFLKLSPKEAVKWLAENKDEAGKLFREFLDLHGHRCIKEADMREKSWASDPEKLGESLQASVENYTPDAGRRHLEVNEAIANLKTRISFTDKLFLKWLIPKARKSVGGRERGKSMVIKISDKFKQAYYRLGKLMKKEGRLPDSDLLFFLTHGEIGKLLRTRSSKLVSRALRRRRMHTQLNGLIFPEISLNFPVQPETFDEELYLNGNSLTIQGCPVSHGVIKGRARVVLSLEQAKDIKHGDILIVRTTDIGWSPYFPLISGLVAEIGSMISHGAVVAREYGLPCIVSAKRATQLFTSGDYVLLNGEKGTVQKLMTEDTQ